ncbi:MAG: TrmH family RNA methyltransferase [Chloroflexota bacterium]
MISSTANEKVKLLRSLHEAKGRKKNQSFLVEGVRLVEEALRAGIRPSVVLVDQEQLVRTDRGAELLASLPQSSWTPVTANVLKAVATTVTPQGIVAALPIPRPAEPVVLGSLALVLDRLADPGNVGTILRTAEAAGVSTVALVTGTVDPYSPKVVRAGAGAHFHLNLLVEETWSSLRRRMSDREVLVATVEGGRWHFQIDWTKPVALVIGSEAHGVSDEALQAATGRVSIPMVGRAESINAAVAAGVVLFEALRQRMRLQLRH